MRTLLLLSLSIFAIFAFLNPAQCIDLNSVYPDAIPIHREIDSKSIVPMDPQESDIINTGAFANRYFAVWIIPKDSDGNPLDPDSIYVLRNEITVDAPMHIYGVITNDSHAGIAGYSPQEAGTYPFKLYYPDSTLFYDGTLVVRPREEWHPEKSTINAQLPIFSYRSIGQQNVFTFNPPRDMFGNEMDTNPKDVQVRLYQYPTPHYLWESEYLDADSNNQIIIPSSDIVTPYFGQAILAFRSPHYTYEKQFIVYLT